MCMNRNLKKLAMAGSMLLLLAGNTSCQSGDTSRTQVESLTLGKQVLLDKIKGGWAGQAIGCFRKNRHLMHMPMP